MNKLVMQVFSQVDWSMELLSPRRQEKMVAMLLELSKFVERKTEHLLRNLGVCFLASDCMYR